MRPMLTDRALLWVVCALVASPVVWAQTYPQEWDRMDVAALTELARSYRWQTPPASRETRVQLARYVYGRYQAASVQGPAIDGWLPIMATLGPYYSQEAKARFVGDISALVPDAAASAALDRARMVILTRSLAQLGQPDLAKPVATAWLSHFSGAQDLGPVELGEVIETAKFLDDQYADILTGLAAQVTSRFMNSSEGAAALGARDCFFCAGALGAVLTPAQRHQWIASIRAAFVDAPEVIGAMPAPDFRYLAQALVTLSDPRAPTVIADWVLSHDGWKSWDPSHVRFAIVQGLTGDQPQVLAAREQVGRQVERALPGWSADANLEMLYDVGEMLHQLKLSGQGVAYLPMAEALVRVAQEDSPVSYAEPPKKYLAYGLSTALGTPQTREILEVQLSDAQGAPRPLLAQVLAWAYRDAGQLYGWQARLEVRLTDERLAPDARAQWAQARAYSDWVKSNRGLPCLSGRKWLDQAMALAEGPLCRFTAAQMLAWGYAGSGRHEEAIAMLGSMSEQLTGLAGETSGLVQQLQKAKVDHDLQFAAQARQSAAEASAARTHELRRRLSQAQAKGDAREVARYERLLGQR